MIKVDNTLLTDLASCDAKGITRHILNRRGIEDKLAANMGNVYHDALEGHFRGYDKQQTMGIFDAAYDRLIPPGEQPEEPRFARENCRTIMRRYIDIRPIERFPFVAVEFEKTIGVELVPGEITFYMKRDLLGQDRQSGLFYPVDHKTTGNITPWWAKSFRMSSQLTGYCWGTGVLAGQEVLECYVNALQISKLPDSNRKCKSHGVPYVECGPEHAKFELLQYAREPEQIEKWRQDAIITARLFGTYQQVYNTVEMLQFAPRRGAFTGGCTFCEYKKWCAVGFKPEWADAFTVIERWAPWDAELAVSSA